MNKNFTFGLDFLKTKVGRGSTIIRKLPASIKEVARFYYTPKGELRAIVDNCNYAWKSGMIHDKPEGITLTKHLQKAWRQI